MATKDEEAGNLALDLALAKAWVAEYEVRVDYQQKLVTRADAAGSIDDANEARCVLAEYCVQLEQARESLLRLQEGNRGG